MGRERHWSRPFKRGEKEAAVGCMSGVLQFFDLQYCYMQPQQQSQACKRDSLRGLEAPRNSLELEMKMKMDNASSSTTEVDDMKLWIQLHPKEPKASEKDQLSETSSLQGSKAPNVVARLMGLDILPDQASPRTSSPTMRSHPRESHRLTVQRRDVSLPINETTRYESGVRSLPDTPRISSSRRSDVGPRLSLQLMNKENIDIPDFNYYSRSGSRDAISSSPFSSRKSKIKEGKFYDENRSPSTYAREIVKQVKESVSRRVGLLDITNTSSRNRSGSDESIYPTINTRKMRKHTRLVSEESKQSKPSTSSFSPRLKFLETKTKRMENKDPISTSNSPKPSSSSSSPRPHSSPSPLSSSLKEPEKPKSKQVLKSTAKCKKASCERFTQRPPASSQAARKKCKIPISNNLLVQIHPPSNVIQNPTQTVVSSQLPSGSSQQQYEEQEKLKKSRTNQDSSLRTTATDDAEFQYVKTILESTAIDCNTTRSCFSPLDPSIFHHLEHSFQSNPSGGPLHHRCNRRLLFDLVDEILHEALKPWLERRKSPFSFSSTLIDKVVWQLRSFRPAKCETLQDINGVVGLDLAGANLGGYWWYTSLDEEVDSVVFEMEREIFDSLLQEVVLMMMLMKRSQPLNGVMVW